MSDKTARRTQRNLAIKGFNALAQEFEQESLVARPEGDDVVGLHDRLRAIIPPVPGRPRPRLGPTARRRPWDT